MYSDTPLHATFLQEIGKSESFVCRYPYLKEKKYIYEYTPNRVYAQDGDFPIPNVWQMYAFERLINNLPQGTTDIGIASFEETDTDWVIEDYNTHKPRQLWVDFRVKNGTYYDFKYFCQDDNYIDPDTVYKFVIPKEE